MDFLYNKSAPVVIFSSYNNAYLALAIVSLAIG